MAAREKRRARRALWLALAFAAPVPILAPGEGFVPVAKLALLTAVSVGVLLTEGARGAVPTLSGILGGQVILYLVGLWLVAWLATRFAPARLGGVAALLLAGGGAWAWSQGVYADPFATPPIGAVSFPDQATEAKSDFDPSAWYPEPAPRSGLPFERTEWREPCEHYDALRRPFFGDTHIHTAFSFDAWGQGTRNRPRDAYRFARGEPVGIQPYGAAGEPLRHVQLRRPLDFVLLSDHSEMLGEVRICQTPGMPGYDDVMCRMARRWPLLGYIIVNSQMMDDANPIRYGLCGPDGRHCREAARIPWQEIQEAAEEAYDRSAACSFTPFVGFEWSGNPDSAMIHRNVLFRNAEVPQELSNYVDDRTGEALWAWLLEACIEGAGRCDVLAIPHNSNLSGGRLFPLETADGNPLDREYAELRARIERLLEVTQHKGDSECRADGRDPLCDFETLRFGLMRQQATPWQQTDPAPRSYAREILVDGLLEQARIGLNPFKLGLIGASDTHLGTPGLVDEADYPGHGAGIVSARLEVPRLVDDVRFNPGGLQGVWAEENSRDALFAAMQRRETWGTTGPRIVVRTFGGFDLPEDLCQHGDWVARGDAHGVPMGGDLRGAPEGAGLHLAILAHRDPGIVERPGTDLQRIQVVKLWEHDGEAHEAVIEVAGDPDNGADVDLDTCAPRGQGFASLCTVWRDPDFDPDDHALYYVRVVENPTCRWTTWACNAQDVSCDDPASHPGALAACCDPEVPKTIQERAWTSPIWYTPSG